MKKCLILVQVVFFAAGMLAFAQNTSPGQDEAAKAWNELEKVHRVFNVPVAWRNQEPKKEEVAQFQKKVIQSAYTYSKMAQDFIRHYPTNENVHDARIIVVFALSHAVAAGDTNAEKYISSFVSGILSNRSIPENDRVAVFMHSENVNFMKRVGMRLFTEDSSFLQKDYETAALEATLKASRLFPTNGMIYTMLVAIAQRSPEKQRKELATVVIGSKGAPEEVKTLASHILVGTEPYEIGRPLDIHFTAIDGRDVDLSKLKGKVVMIEFWSASSRPCVALMPEVKSLYEKLHPRGFEIIGISLDSRESLLRNYLKKNPLPWPSYFDGKGWQNQYSLRYGVFTVPAMWVVDRRGDLRTVDARRKMEEIVTQLLDEKATL